MPSPSDREKALDTALAQIDRQFGKGSVMRLGSDDRAPVEAIPTGSIALDVALGIGGLPELEVDLPRLLRVVGLVPARGVLLLTESLLGQLDFEDLGELLPGPVVKMDVAAASSLSSSAVGRGRRRRETKRKRPLPNCRRR